MGSKKKKLQNIAMSVHNWCKNQDVQIEGKWMPRSKNLKSDSLSRMTDCEDWCVKKCVFNYFDMIWGPYTCERFADLYNSKCKKFNSKYWCKGSIATNAFDQIWTHNLNCIVPPPKVIPEVLRKIENDKCSCTLVIPESKSAAYWPMLIDWEGNFKSHVKMYIEYKTNMQSAGAEEIMESLEKKCLLFSMIFLKME